MLSEKLDRQKIFLFWLLILFCNLFLSGCSGKSLEIQTKFSFNEDGSGSREMILQWNQKDYQEIFSQSIQDLNGLMDASCPTQMQWTYTDSGGSCQYVFRIEFTSKEEYQQKVESILNRDVQINLEQPLNAFTSGLKLQEDFSSIDLLEWLKQLLVEQNYGTQAEIDKLLVNGDYEVNYKNQQYTGKEDVINVDALIVTPVKQMDILTSFQSGAQYSRRILLQFDKTNVESHKDSIAEYLSQKLPKETQTWWEEHENAIFVIELNNVSWNAQNQLMKNFMGGGESYIFVSDSKTKGIFSFDVEWDEYLDVSALLIDDRESIPVGYYIQGEEGISLSAAMSNNGKYALKDSNLYGGYQQVFQKNLSKEEVICTASKVYIVSDIDIDIKFKKQRDVRQNIVFHFAHLPQEEEQDIIMEKLMNRADSQADVISEVDQDNHFSICIEQSGKMKDVAQVMQEIYGANNSISYEASEDLWQWKQSASFVHQIDFTDFIENDAALTKLNYQLSFAFGERIQEDSISSTVNLKDGSQEISGNTYIGSLSGLNFALTLRTNKINTFLVWFVGGGIALVIILVLVFILAGKMKKMLRKISGGVSDFNQAFLSEEEDDTEDAMDSYMMEDRFRKNISGRTHKSRQSKKKRSKWKRFLNKPLK